MTQAQMKSKLRETLNPDRYQHSIRVMEEAEKLAIHYGIDRNKAVVAGLLHDCAKYIQPVNAMEMLRSQGIEVDEIQKKMPSLLHSIIGALIASSEYKVKDQDILNAIYWHTTGRAGMTPLEKVIYVSDYIEYGRSFPEAEEARIMAYHDLNRCILLCTDATIRHILLKQNLIHPLTIETRNEALARINSGLSGL